MKFIPRFLKSLKEIGCVVAFQVVMIAVGVGLVWFASKVQVEPPEYTAVVDGIPLSLHGLSGLVALLGLGIAGFSVMLPFFILWEGIREKRRARDFRIRLRKVSRTTRRLAQYAAPVVALLGVLMAMFGGLWVVGSLYGVTIRQPTDLPVGFALVLTGIGLAAGGAAFWFWYA